MMSKSLYPAAAQADLKLKNTPALQNKTKHETQNERRAVVN